MTFVAVLAAITVAVLVFAPERAGRGVGIRSVPVETSFRSAAFGKDKVLVITNTHSSTITNVRISLILKSDAAVVEIMAGRPVRFDRHIESWPPGKKFEFGWLEGWKFPPESIVVISAPGYTDLTLRL